ncbi:hypothetical protein RRG08_062179 [Elysia crispata]|uniref:Uncharacterized protein n=1 Tax=Elysia crispata TaxID=231223 RepID=A0AAE1D703_9GAST|nr:hypothetical protein RRG08_062179 [Elysia crispata]
MFSVKHLVVYEFWAHTLDIPHYVDILCVSPQHKPRAQNSSPYRNDPCTISIRKYVLRWMQSVQALLWTVMDCQHHGYLALKKSRFGVDETLLPIINN